MTIKDIRPLLETETVTLVEEVNSILGNQKLCKTVDIYSLYQYDHLEVLKIRPVPFGGFEASNIEIFISIVVTEVLD